MSGEGFGHAARACALVGALLPDYEIEFWVPETIQPLLKSTFPEVPIRTIPLVGLVKKNHRVRIFLTGLKTIPLLFFSFKKIDELAELLRSEKISAVISDYEPLVARAAKKAKLPLLALNHQGVIEHRFFDGIDHFFAKLANWTMMPYFTSWVVSSFYNGDVGPILRERVDTLVPTSGDYVFVYLKPSFKDKLLEMLKAFPEVKFRFFPDPEHDFLEALAGAKAVIAPAGHQLICECLVLKKPALVFPEKMQYEQRLNAEMLERSGWGLNGDNGEMKDNVNAFLKSLSEFPKPQDPTVSFCFKNDSAHAVRLIQAFLNKVLV